MPYFVILPVWVVTALVAIMLLFVRRLRKISIYVLASSTCGLVISFLLSTAVLMIGPKLGEFVQAHIHWQYAQSVLLAMLLIGYVAAIPIGGVLGVVVGLIAAHPLARRCPMVFEA